MRPNFLLREILGSECRYDRMLFSFESPLVVASVGSHRERREQQINKEGRNAGRSVFFSCLPAFLIVLLLFSVPSVSSRWRSLSQLHLTTNGLEYRLFFEDSQEVLPMPTPAAPRRRADLRNPAQRLPQADRKRQL